MNDNVDSLVLPGRIRLAASALLLAVITLFDPSIMRGMLLAWHRSNRGDAKRLKARILCGQNPTVDPRPTGKGEKQ